MTALTWETLLLLAVVYFAGCCIGCIARRRSGRRAVQPAVSLPIEQQPAAEPVASLSVQQPVTRAPLRPSTQPVTRAVTQQRAHEPFRRADQPAADRGAVPVVEPANPVEQTAQAVARFERALSGDDGAPISLATGGEADTALVPRAVTPQPAASRDDLKRIRSIDEGLEQRLNALDVTSFEAIAQWTAADVARISRELGFKGRIQQENWIEQAQLLAKGADTLYARRKARGQAPAAVPIDDEGEPRSLRELTATHTTSERQPASATPQSIAEQGPSDQNPDVADRAAFSNRTPQSVVTTEAAPQATARAVGSVAREKLSDRPPQSVVAAETVSQATARAVGSVAQEKLSDRAPQSMVATEAALQAMARAVGSVAQENLQRIRGINAEIEQLLLEQGVRRYSQIASWNKVDTERIDGLLGQNGRVARENWIEQAQILARGGDTAYSRDVDRRTGAQPDSDAAASDVERLRTSDISSLRSVKSEALRGDDTATAQGVRIGGLAGADDLKRIRGIGVLIEKRLHAAGIISYEQIANWTAADIDRVSQLLDFKGRIERENWVEQARILASGGQTEFSRRLDRGEIVASRSRLP